MMMTFLNEIKCENYDVKFWSGFDIDKILSHSKCGEDGFMVVFIDDIELERKKFERDQKISSIFGINVIYFEEIIETIDNSYILLYQSKGLEKELMEIIIERFTKSKEYQPIQGIVKKMS
jgi:hypothetical protein